MRLAFEGTHVTGKTTLLNAYVEYRHALTCENKENDFGYVTGIARNIIARGFPLNKDGNVYSYINYVNDQLKAERTMCNYKDFISDRTLLSPLAYSLTNKNLPRPFIPDYFIDMLKNVWLLEKERFDLYIYFPIEFSMNEKDDIHPADIQYRVDIDNAIHQLLDEYKIPHFHMTGSVEERLRKLIRIFEGVLEKNK